MRMVLTAAVAISGVLSAPPVSAEPANTCPPTCNRIPATAWVNPSVIPLDSVYSWPKLGNVAVTARAPRFRFEELCAAPGIADDPRRFAVAERATVSNPSGEWQLQAQVLHWRGETWIGGDLARGAFAAAVDAIRDCQATNSSASASLIIDQPDRFAAAISGPVVLHEYLLADPVNSTVTELALWVDAPARRPWPAISDTDVLEAMGLPLCTAYIDSCP